MGRRLPLNNVEFDDQRSLGSLLNCIANERRKVILQPDEMKLVGHTEFQRGIGQLKRMNRGKPTTVKIGVDHPLQDIRCLVPQLSSACRHKTLPRHSKVIHSQFTQPTGAVTLFLGLEATGEGHCEDDEKEPRRDQSGPEIREKLQKNDRNQLLHCRAISKQSSITEHKEG